MSETYAPTYPKHGTQAQRVLNSLLTRRFWTELPTIEVVAQDAGAASTAASARIRELRNKHGWDIRVTTRKLGPKRTLHEYQIRHPQDEVSA
jgi:hypothetical protein